MITPRTHHQYLRGLEATVDAELVIVSLSQSEKIFDEPQSEWLFEPSDVEREEIGLRSLLGAVEAVERGSHPRRTPRP